MSEQGWEHIILAFLGAIPATVAALSSLRNGRTMKKNGGYVLPSRAPATMASSNGSGTKSSSFGHKK
jgi:hypothetical protein